MTEFEKKELKDFIIRNIEWTKKFGKLNEPNKYEHRASDVFYILTIRKTDILKDDCVQVQLNAISLEFSLEIARMIALNDFVPPMVIDMMIEDMIKELSSRMDSISKTKDLEGMGGFVFTIPPRSGKDFLKKKEVKTMFNYKKVIFNGPATIIIWEDGAKTVVKVKEGTEYNAAAGIAFCFMERALGSKEAMHRVLNNELARKANDDLNACGLMDIIRKGFADVNYDIDSGFKQMLNDIYGKGTF